MMNNKTNTQSLHLLAILFFALIIAGCGSGNGPTSVPDSNTSPAVYQLVWSDEFIENSPPNAGKWSFDTGYGANGWGNDEWQNYTSDPANVNVSNGILEITARCDTGICGQRDGSITSARIKTEDKFSIKYGKIQARIKPPAGTGMWPAFWMLGSNINTDGWPKSGEIDIMEMSYVYWDNKTTNFTTHWWDESLTPPAWNSYGEEKSFPTPLTDDYHIFEVDWNEERIIGKIDGQTYYTNHIDPDTMEEFLNDFFVILNVAVGGSLGGVPDPGPWEFTMSVDWIRVYEKVASPALGIYSESHPEPLPGYDRIVNSIEFGGNLATPDTLSTGVVPVDGSKVLAVDFSDAGRGWGGIFFRYARADIFKNSTLIFSIDSSKWTDFDSLTVELQDSTNAAARIQLSSYTPTVSVPGDWKNYEIPLSAFPGVDLTDIFLMGFVNPVHAGNPIFNGTLYFDEIYLRSDPCTAPGNVSFNAATYATSAASATISVTDQCAASSTTSVSVDNGVETIPVDLWIQPNGIGTATVTFATTAGATDDATDTIEIVDGDTLTVTYTDANATRQTDTASITGASVGPTTAGIYSETHTDPMIPYIGIINSADFSGNQTVVDENSTAVTPFDGNIVLSVDFQNSGSTYGGAILNFGGVNLSAYSSLKFAINTSAITNYADMVIQLEDGSATPSVFLSSYTPSVSGDWSSYEIPLAHFAGIDRTNITLLGFWNLSSTAGSVTLTYGTIYLDDIHLETPAPPAPGGAGAGIYSESHTDPVIAYTGIINAADFSGNQTVADENSTAVTPYDGNVVLSVDFQNSGSTYGGAILNFGGVDISAYSSLRFSINTAAIADYADLVIQLEDGAATPSVFLSSYTPSVSGDWSSYEIPLSDFSGVDLTNVTLLGLWNLSSTTGSVTLTYGTIYLDDIYLVAADLGACTTPGSLSLDSATYTADATSATITFADVCAADTLVSATVSSGGALINIGVMLDAGGNATKILNFGTTDEASSTIAIADGDTLLVTFADANSAVHAVTSSITAGSGGGSGTGATGASGGPLSVSFDDSAIPYVLTDFGGTSSALAQDPTDPTNTVAMTTKSNTAETWAGTTVEGVNITYPFTATDTRITLRVYSPDAGITVRLKLEDALDNTHTVETEAVTTVANAWETLTFDFSNEAAGTAALNLPFTYNKASIFFNFGVTGATAGEKTYYWDTIEFVTGGGGGTPATAPTTAAPTPTVAASGVISVFSDAYTDITGVDVNPNWGQSTVVTTESIAGNATLKYAGLNYQGTDFTGNPQDVSGMATLHVDFWTPDATAVNIYLIGEGETAYALPISNGSWVSVDIPLSSFTGVNLANVSQLKVDDNTTGEGATIFFDNIYFAASAGPPATAPTTAAPTPTVAAAGVISVFSDAYTDITGVDVNPNWGQATVVTTESIGGNATLKYAGLNYQGTDFTGNPQDVSGKATLHVDFWTPDATAVNIYLIGGGETAYALPISNGSWVSVDIPLSSFTGVNLASVTQLKVDDNTTSEGATIFFDNIYFYGTGTPPAPITDPTVTATAPGDLTSDVVLYSDAKTADANITSYLATWSSNIAFTGIQIGTENALRYVATSSGSGADGSGVAGIEMAPLDVSSKTNLHMDFYAVGDVDLLKIKFVSADLGVPAGYASMLDNYNVTVKDNWFSIDIAKADIPLAPGAAGIVNWAALEQIVFITYGPASTIDQPTRYYLDNIYFY